jgi:hypothetical protein
MDWQKQYIAAKRVTIFNVTLDEPKTLDSIPNKDSSGVALAKPLALWFPAARTLSQRD